MNLKTMPMQISSISREQGRPRLGFLGLGWIGRHRLESLARSGLAEIAALADEAPEQARQAAALAPGAAVAGGLEDLLRMDLDGVVIATPSALHAQQTLQALEAGLAVFCQIPLGRSALETRLVVESAREADRLLGVDLSYRHVVGMSLVRERVRAGAIGRVFAVDLVFHNACGPGKAWSFDPALAGGGCVMDLGIHLVDLALWTLDYPEVERVSSRLFSGGAPLKRRSERAEDYAVARIELEHSATLNLTCSWGLSAGCDCVIEATFRGTEGAVSLHNLNGSFYELCAERFSGTRREVLDPVDDTWGSRAALAWARRLGRSRRFDPEIQQLIPAAEVLDAIYGT